MYVLAAVCPTARTGSLASLRTVLLPGQRYVHWRDETTMRRAALVDAFNAMAFDVTVAVMERVPNRGQERARAACMVALAREFDRGRAVRWDIEGRRERLDQRDIDTIRNAHRSDQLSKAPMLNFVSKSASPALWVADAAASTASATSLGSVDPIIGGDRCGSRGLSCSPSSPRNASAPVSDVHLCTGAFDFRRDCPRHAHYAPIASRVQPRFGTGAADSAGRQPSPRPKRPDHSGPVDTGRHAVTEGATRRPISWRPAAAPAAKGSL